MQSIVEMSTPLDKSDRGSGAFDTALEEALGQDLEFLTGEEVTIDQIQRLSSTLSVVGFVSYYEYIIMLSCILQQQRWNLWRA